MASSSKPRRPSSKQQNRAGKARVISVKRTDVLPRKSNASAAGRRLVVPPPIEVPPALSGEDSRPRRRRPQPAPPLVARTTKKRSAGSASRKLKKGVPTEVTEDAVAHDIATEAELEVEASAIVEETTIEEVAPPLPAALSHEPATVRGPEIGRLPSFQETSPTPRVRTTADGTAPAMQGQKGDIITVASRLLSTLLRWTGVRR